MSRGIKVPIDLSTKRKRAKNREEIVRKLAGWLSHEEAEELREAVEIFEEIHEKEPSLFAAKGEKIPSNDVWVAACCMEVGGTLLT